MTTWDAYHDAARAYASAVRALFTPAESGTHVSAGRGPLPAASLAPRAETLVFLSDGLTRKTAALLADPEPSLRADAATRLLAKALTDLQVSAHLLAAADAENPMAAEARAADLSDMQAVLDLADLEDNLSLLLRGPAAVSEARGAVAPDPGIARQDLARATVDTLVAIRDRAARSGQTALTGLLGLGTTELLQAASVVGMDIAQAIGQAAQVTRLYNLVREFALKAYDTLLTLLGPTLARMATGQMLVWIGQIESGAEFGRLLDKVYETPATGAGLGQMVAASQAGPEQFMAATQDLRLLTDQYDRQIGLTDKLLRGLALFGIAPAAALPQGRLLLGAAFFVLGSYAVLAGADFVDAPHLRLLNRVPGVRTIVENHLKPA